GRLKDISQFEDIILKGSPGKGMVRLKDVARIELGAKSYNMSCTSMGDESAVIGIFLQPGANALEVGNRVKTRMVELSKRFPDGIVYNIGFDTTDYVEESINEVVETLYIAAVLVVAVILIFLQNWKAAVIPIITIPVSLIGTFGVMAALGVSINMLSLFGIVLAIGIVVDDAIVVVENVMRNINQSGLSPREATIRAMQEVSGPIIATTLVLLAVFIPTAFLGGITGQLYRQFALTIATATLFSSLNALTLSPALSALLLKPSTGRQNIFFRGFNFLFDRVQSIYGKVVGTLIRRAFIMGILFILITCAAFWKFDQLPKGFVPNEDQGYVMMVVQLPDAASLQRTNEVVSTINRQLAHIPGVKNYDAIPGYSLMDGMTASNAATAFITFDPWEERLPKGLTLDAMMGQLWGVASQIQDAVVLVFPPPPIMGLGTAGGFEMRIQDRGNLGLTTLQKEADGLMMAANGDGRFQQVFTTFRANIPQLEAVVNRTQVKSYDISVSDVFETLQANMGSYYVNDFNKFGRTYQVRVQADEAFRAHAEDVRRLRVRNTSGGMVPLGAVASVTEILGPQVINRYNMYPAAQIIGQGIPGISSGQAMDLMEKLANETLASGMGFEWTAMSFQEKASKGKSVVIFLLAVMFIYLVLCAQYESWSLPLTVVLTVPLAVLGTVIAVAVRGMDINVYSQIGIVLLIALACKTGILIAEFAKAGRESGQSIEEAAFTAATLRFRPILMTAITFILGVTPLVVATGAGAAGRQALGTAVFSGMISATGLLIFFVPVFYRIIQGFSERLRKKTGIKPEAGLVKSNAET
ncbi:MAG: efflux RND transporter permease subunit, partial [Desulfobacterales bacterium]|nr:efflux RND transporter permease subunit [Desulfobacterales bacterium]